MFAGSMGEFFLRSAVRAMLLNQILIVVAEVFTTVSLWQIKPGESLFNPTVSKWFTSLWALSLAHAQLSEVLWDMTIANVLEMTGIVGIVAIVIVGVLWLILTIGILCVMEVGALPLAVRPRSELIALVVLDRRGI